MDLAKNLFVSKSHEGYAGKTDQVHIDTAVSDDEDNTPHFSPLDDYDRETASVADFLATVEPITEGPFSAVTPSMWPQDIICSLKESDEYCKIDEFGFHLDKYQNEWGKSREPFVENSQTRLQWLSQLEFNRKNDELSWENVSDTITPTDKLCDMVKHGIPHSLRPQIWMRLCGALIKKKNSEMTYRDVVKASNYDHLISSQQIEKDVLRTLPYNACFSCQQSTGVARLRRILRAITWFFPDVGYCQGMGVVIAHLLLFMEEEDVFWTMTAIMEEILPATFYVNGLTGLLADVRVLRDLIGYHIPDVDRVFQASDVEITVLIVAWFVPLFCNILHTKVALRVLDLLFFHGSIALFKVALGIIKMAEKTILERNDSAVILNALADAPGNINDADHLIEVTFKVSEMLTNEIISAHRHKHLSYMLVDRGTLIGNPNPVANLPKQHLNRRNVKKPKSMIQMILFNGDASDEDMKMKNIKQTELLVDLRDSVVRICNHFISVDPTLSNAQLIPDYSIESHAKDHENYNITSRNKRRRAKALLDFERNDEDELGFRKNDIITLISQKDEHCWIGEINGLKGWFPAKFVEVLDERSKLYSSAGDDSVTEVITDLVRGALCPALKQICEHSMKSSFLGGPCHPWLFIEEAALWEVEKDFTSVYSRLTLCKTYRLDEDGKVLTPEELLYRCVQLVNLSHDEAHAQMDVKFRSLVCLGLNEQVLHLWLEVLCSCVDVVKKWYHPWSFICSPGWVQIKCELRVLSQFSFNLNPDWELPPKREPSKPLKDGVRDLLVKHHLFSWDL